MPLGHQGSTMQTRLANCMKTAAARSFMHSRVDKLKGFLRDNPGDAVGRAVLGETYMVLGDMPRGLRELKAAAATDTDDRELRWYLEKARRQHDAHTKQLHATRHLAARANKDTGGRTPPLPSTAHQGADADGCSDVPRANADADSATACGLSSARDAVQLPPGAEVERVPGDSLSSEEFFSKYAATRTPVIITGVVDKMTATPWTIDHVAKQIGNHKVTVKQLVHGSVEWARLEDAEMTTVQQFVDGLKEGKERYLFDWSLPLFAPTLAAQVTIPKYFAGNMLQKTPAGSKYRDSWPSLFIAPKGQSTSHCITSLPFFQNGAKSGFEIVFFSHPQHVPNPE